jgi:hypothetical protein
MRNVRVELKSDVVRPGEMLEGNVIVECDEYFTCNRLSLRITGTEKTEMMFGDNRYYDSYTHISEHIVLQEQPTYRQGRELVPFSYRIPEGVPRTLRGHDARIEYKAKAIIELDWRLDPSHTQEFIVQTQPIYLPPDPDVTPVLNEENGLVVQLPTGVLRQDKGLDVRIKIERDRVDQAVIALKERLSYTCRSHETSFMSTILTATRDIDLMDLGRWIDCTLGAGMEEHTPVNGRLIAVDYLVEVKLGVKWSLDPYIRIPVRVSAPPPRRDVDQTRLDFGLGR